MVVRRDGVRDSRDLGGPNGILLDVAGSVAGDRLLSFAIILVSPVPLSGRVIRQILSDLGIGKAQQPASENRDYSPRCGLYA